LNDGHRWEALERLAERQIERLETETRGWRTLLDLLREGSDPDLPDLLLAPHLYKTIREWDIEEAGELRAAFQRAASEGNENASEVLRMLTQDDPFWGRGHGG
jgi:hypothetical protein